MCCSFCFPEEKSKHCSLPSPRLTWLHKDFKHLPYLWGKCWTWTFIINKCVVQLHVAVTVRNIWILKSNRISWCVDCLLYQKAGLLGTSIISYLVCHHFLTSLVFVSCFVQFSRINRHPTTASYRLSPPHEVCNNHDQAAHHHALRHQLEA